MAVSYLKEVTTLSLDTDTCTGCGVCAVVCPHGVLAVMDGKAAIIDRDACMECAACMMNCPVNAVTVKKGVGCAAAVIQGFLRGTEPTCGCSSESSSGCC